MNREIATLFFSMSHDEEELIETFSKVQLLELYTEGCLIRKEINYCINNFQNFNHLTGMSLGGLFSNKYHVSKELNVLNNSLKKLGYKFINEQEYLILSN